MFKVKDIDMKANEVLLEKELSTKPIDLILVKYTSRYIKIK